MLVTIGPAIGIGITTAITALRAAVASRWRETDRETRINEAIYIFLQRLRDPHLTPEQRARTLDSLEELEQMRDDLIMERARGN